MPPQLHSSGLLSLKGNLDQNFKGFDSAEFKEQSSEPMMVKLNYLLQMAFNQCSVPADGARDEAPRPRDHAPCGGDDEAEVHQIRMEATSMVPTPGTTARAKTTKILHQGYPVPTDLCPHKAEHARKIGNKHGRFLECTACGLVKKALQENYVVPITNEQILIYALQHGIRSHPGGTVTAVMRSTQAYSESLVKCYSRSSRPSSAPPSRSSRTSTRRTSGTTPMRTQGEVSRVPHSSPESPTWEEVGMEDEDMGDQ